eukprot:COSAG01_NODE_3886_length_5586_cov_7.993257_3_plen_26_part_01
MASGHLLSNKQGGLQCALGTIGALDD